MLVSQTSGAFRSTKTSALNFQQLPDVSGKAFSKSFTKEDNLARYTKIFNGSLLSIQLCFRDFWNFRLNSSYFGNSTVSGISENFSETFLYHLPLFLNFRKFWMNGKRPSFRGETTDAVEKSRLFLRVVIPSCLSTMTLNSDTECILPWNRNNVH